MNLGIGAIAFLHGTIRPHVHTRTVAIQTEPDEPPFTPSISRPETPVLIPHVPFESLALVEECPVGNVPDECCSQFVNATLCDIWNVVQQMNSKASCAVIHDLDSQPVGTYDWLSIVAAIIDGSGHHARSMTPLVLEEPNASIAQVIRRLRRGVRYVTVRGDPLKVISQGTILRFVLAQSKEREEWTPFIEKLRNATLHGIGPESIYSIHAACTARQAYEQMAHREITSMPIVDDRRRCTGVISVSDTHILDSPASAQLLLSLSVHDFVQRSRGHVRPSTTVIVAQRDDTLWDTVLRMIDHKIHHIYIVNSQHTPVGIVSFGDVLRFCF